MIREAATVGSLKTLPFVSRLGYSIDHAGSTVPKPRLGSVIRTGGGVGIIALYHDAGAAEDWSMTFYEMLAQVLELLQREGRVSYRALKLQFHLDDDYLEGLKEELI